MLIKRDLEALSFLSSSPLVDKNHQNLAYLVAVGTASKMHKIRLAALIDTLLEENPSGPGYPALDLASLALELIKG